MDDVGVANRKSKTMPREPRDGELTAGRGQRRQDLGNPGEAVMLLERGSRGEGPPKAPVPSPTGWHRKVNAWTSRGAPEQGLSLLRGGPAADLRGRTPG